MERNLGSYVVCCDPVDKGGSAFLSVAKLAQTMVGFLMGLTLQLARFLTAAIIFTAFVVPSIAFAHEGHAHHNSATTGAQATPAKSVSPSMAQPAQYMQSAFQFHANSGVAANCGTHCCGGVAGMACCGAGLVVGFAADPFVKFSDLFLIPLVRLPAGLPPEAPPKPPKSFV